MSPEPGRRARDAAAPVVARFARVAGVLAAASCAPPGAPGPGGAGDAPNGVGAALAPCVLPGAWAWARCGTVRVPEARGHPGGRTLALRVVVLPARRHPAAPDPVVFLDGGPGRGAAADAGYPASELDALRDTRDLVLVDQRGTGRSAPLDCAGDEGRLGPQLAASFPVAAVRACRAALAARADLTQYTTAAAADDLAEVLAALGYRRANLWGGSYGTRLALIVVRRHPARVRSVVLNGVVSPAQAIPLAAGAASARALAHAAEACAADAECHRAAPDPLGDVHRVLARLRRAPAVVRVWNGRRFEREVVVVTARGFAERAWGMLYNAGRAGRLFPSVHQAAAGDWAPFVRAAAQQQRRRRRGRSEGLLLSVLCAEDAPRLARADTARLAAAGPLGLPMAAELVAACAEWPRAPLTPADTAPVVSSVPALLLSGALDPVTPPAWADEAARTLAGAVHVVTPRAGHADTDACTRALTLAVIRAGSTQGIDAGHLPTGCRGVAVRRPPLAAGHLVAARLVAARAVP